MSRCLHRPYSSYYYLLLLLVIFQLFSLLFASALISLLDFLSILHLFTLFLLQLAASLINPSVYTSCPCFPSPFHIIILPVFYTLLPLPFFIPSILSFSCPLSSFLFLFDPEKGKNVLSHFFPSACLALSFAPFELQTVKSGEYISSNAAAVPS